MFGDKREKSERSTEEEDILLCSTKRAKGINESKSIEDETMGESNKELANQSERKEVRKGVGAVGTPNAEVETQKLEMQMESSTREIVSYRDKLLGFNGSSGLENEVLDQMEEDDRMLEDDDVEEIPSESVAEEDPACPKFQLQKKNSWICASPGEER